MLLNIKCWKSGCLVVEFCTRGPTHDKLISNIIIIIIFNNNKSFFCVQ